MHQTNMQCVIEGMCYPLLSGRGLRLSMPKLRFDLVSCHRMKNILRISSYGSDEKIKNKKSQEFSVKDD